MFGGVQDQFHQFFAPPPQQQQQQQQQPQARASHHHPNSSIPLSFSLLHGTSLPNSSSPFPIFDTYPPPPFQPPIHHHHQMLLLQQQPMQLQYQHSKSVKQEGTEVGERERERSSSMDQPDFNPSWSHDEVLALFRVRSAMENWFPQFTWEHVSRKMEEIGFRRSPEKCKEKFEEESRYLHSTANTINADDLSCPTKNNYRIFSELEELYHQNDVVLEKENPQERVDDDQLVQDQQADDGDEGQGVLQERLLVEENDGGSEATDQPHQIIVDEIDEVEKENENGNENENENEKTMEKKRGKGHGDHHHHDHGHGKFEIFKGFCEEIVSKMMAHQEELHTKILEDLIKRDEEKIAREEAWKKQELERINKEMETRAKEQVMAGDRQAKIIEFLKKFSMINNSNDNNNGDEVAKAPVLQNPSSSATHSSLNYNNMATSSNDESLSQTSNSLTTHIDPITPASNPAQKNKTHPSSRKPRPAKRPCSTASDHTYDDTGKRWPREEVLELINIRCNLDSNNIGVSSDSPDGNEGSAKNPPLWERISKSMAELGYKRSAKRCKEKWENINKYFRKTKDSKKKRTADSRTCPYFHQLSHLYSQGRMSSDGGGVGGGSAAGSSINNVGDGATLNVSDQVVVNGHVQVTTPSAL